MCCKRRENPPKIPDLDFNRSTAAFHEEHIVLCVTLPMWLIIITEVVVVAGSADMGVSTSTGARRQGAVVFSTVAYTVLMADDSNVLRMRLCSIRYSRQYETMSC